MRTAIALLLLLVFTISAKADESPVAEAATPESQSDQPLPTYTATLTPRVPTRGVSLGWSPKGAKIALASSEGSLTGELQLGLEDAPAMAMELSKSEGSEQFDTLWVDTDYDGVKSDAEQLTTTVSERREKLWSSFSTEIDIAVPSTEGKSSTRPYAISLWYVEDPKNPEEAKFIRFSRRGWHEGEVKIDGNTAYIMVCDRLMDGRFDKNDAWAIADTRARTYGVRKMRAIGQHNWFGEQAYRVVDCDPSGLTFEIEPYDPGMTRAEEEEARDPLAADRKEKRAEQPVQFLHDFAKAEAKAKAEGKRLFVDFETTWCGPCKSMDQWVYPAERVVKAVESGNVIVVKVDGDEHEELVERFKVTGYPTMILLGEEGEEIRRTSGYTNVKKMVELLK